MRMRLEEEEDDDDGDEGGVGCWMPKHELRNCSSYLAKGEEEEEEEESGMPRKQNFCSRRTPCHGAHNKICRAGDDP